MTPLLTRAQMRAFDAHAIEASGVPSLVLMENAGRGATEVLVRELLEGDAARGHVIVVCGPGNNGGDGLVMARQLLARGGKPEVVLFGDPARASADVRANLGAWRGLGGQVHAVGSAEELARLHGLLDRATALVDALFGTGLDRPLEGLFADAVRALNASPAPKLAVDLPSGLDADTGAALGAAVHATVTATLGHRKRGLFTPSGGGLAGRVHVVDLGVPAALPPGLGELATLLSPGDLGAAVRPRASNAHKGNGGHVLVVGGSPGTVGAPQLSARGALRAGAGLVTLATWPDVARALDGHVLEVMTSALDPERLAASVEALLAGKKAVVVGPGLGRTPAAKAVVEHLLAAWPGPLVADADALSLFAGHPEALRAGARVIITPHPGEAARLLGVSTDAVEADRFRAAHELVARTGAVVVLKGAHTIVAAPGALPAVSPVACPALATAGSGDVLSGVLGALAAGAPVFEAACAGVMLHALAGEAWSTAHGHADRGLLASEIADAVAGVVARLARA